MILTGYRSIVLANPAKLSVRNNSLAIDNGEVSLIPLEDIRCLMLENRQITLSSALLSRLAGEGIAVYTCADNHLPCSVFTPVNCHSRQLKQLRLQLKQTQPKLKRLWQETVKAKIENQAKCLELLGREGKEDLLRLLPLIRSGDSTNVEGRAAARYFKALFGKDFSRDGEHPVNGALNYGYAIFRGLVARTLTVYGFEPCLGIHHESELNNFNLADDLIEPFRPVVVMYAAQNLIDITQLGTAEKAALLNLLNTEMLSGGEKHGAAYAAERLVMSLAACFSGHKNSIILPKLTGLRRHDYE